MANKKTILDEKYSPRFMDKNLKKPKVSVIMTVFNAEAYLKEALTSVFDQTFSDFEFIIINDGSTDESSQIIQTHTDPRIIFVNHVENAGTITRLNEGVRLAKGEYIARLDSDDVWSDKDKIAKQVTFLDLHHEYGLLGTLGNAIDKNGSTLYSLNYPLYDKNIRRNILIKNCFLNSSVIFRKELPKRIGVYDKEEKHAEDYGLWLRIGTISKFANLPYNGTSYRITAEGDSLSNNIRSIENCILLIKKYRNNYPSFFWGIIKWNLKLHILKIFNIDTFIKIKKFLKK